MHASVTLQRGKTYIFDVSDFGRSHPFRFSTTPDGTFGGGTAFNDGVTYVDEGTITWTVPENLSASVMYYYCTIHAGMAGSGVISITVLVNSDIMKNLFSPFNIYLLHTSPNRRSRV